MQSECSQNSNTEEVLRKISKLERLMQEIRSENRQKHTKVEEHHYIDHSYARGNRDTKEEAEIVEGMTN